MVLTPSSTPVSYTHLIEGYTAQTYPGLLAEIIKERRCELVWEGHRLFDARRLKVTMTREGKTISADDYRLTLPIPQAEIDANSGKMCIRDS